MKSLVATCAIGWFAASIAPAYAEDQVALRLVQTIPVPGVIGRLDHMAVDLEKQRLFLAAVANGTLEVLDLGAGKVINSLTGFKDTQDRSSSAVTSTNCMCRAWTAHCGYFKVRLSV
jgi:hypothetical protein